VRSLFYFEPIRLNAVPTFVLSRGYIPNYGSHLTKGGEISRFIFQGISFNGKGVLKKILPSGFT